MRVHAHRLWILIGVSVLFVAAISPARPDAVTPLDLGVAAYPGSRVAPALTSRLDRLCNVRWRAAPAMRVDAPLREVLEYFRAEQSRIETRAGTGMEPTGRLKEWLQVHPEEVTRYMEFVQAQSGGASREWQILRQNASEIPMSLGGGEVFRGKAFAGTDVELAFGRIVLMDSIATIQLVSPHPSEDGRRLEPGTLVAIIREMRDTPQPVAAAIDDTVPGPEQRDLALKLSGYVLMDQPVGGMVAVSLPRLEKTLVRAPGSGVGVVHSLSGPDEEGFIAYVENHASAGRHYLKSIRLDGRQDEMLFERPGDAVFERGVGTALALSPRGGRVALIGRLSRFQTNRPSFPLRIGPLELWELRSKSGVDTGIRALDRRMSWFPDATRLAYVELVPAEKAPAVSAPDADHFGAGFRGWEAVPVVRVLDVKTRARRTLHIGWDPVVSSDGESVLLRDGDNRWRLLDMQSGVSRPVAWPGDAGGAIALAPGNLVLYWGLPTHGSPPEFTRIYSESVGPRPMKTLKVAELETTRFQTVIGSIDPRREISIGGR